VWEVIQNENGMSKSTNAPMPLRKTGLALKNSVKKIPDNLASLACQNMPAMTKQLKNQNQSASQSKSTSQNFEIM